MKKLPSTIKNFGTRLANIRKDRGFSQRQLAELTGISARMIAYYEVQAKYPPTHLIVPLSKILHVTADELLGIENFKNSVDPEHKSLWRKLQKIATLPKNDQKALMHYLNALVKKNKASSAN